MTPNAPTWGEIERFLGIDGWMKLPSSSRGGSASQHVFFEKVLPDGRVLQTHISHSRHKRPSAGRFSRILGNQMEVSKSEFWEALETGEAVDRPVPLEEEAGVEHPSWVIAVLTGNLHMSAEDIAALSAEEAEALVHEYWLRPKR